MKLIVDMNMSVRWAGALTEAGFEAVHWSQVGAVDAADSTIADFAADTRSVILTRDLDFSAILAAQAKPAFSVVILREIDRFEPGTVTRVVAALRSLALELESGAILSLTSNRLRLRRLPIGRADPIEYPQ